MSHFTVLVIGSSPEKLLAPFHEFECTGADDEYVQDVDRTEEAKADYQAYLNATPREEGSVAVSFREFVKDEFGYEELCTHDPYIPLDRDGKHKYGFVRIVNGEVDKVVRRTNPNAKWDWYQLGGRWSGMLKLKPGTSGQWGERSWTNRDEADDMAFCDQTLKGNVDTESMRKAAEDKARAQYRKFMELTAGTPQPLTWDHIRAEHSACIDGARLAFNEQPAIQALKGSDGTREMFGFFEDFTDYITQTEEQFVQQARAGAISTFAVITPDGKWHQRGDMGWWGMVSDESSNWDEQFAKLWDEIPDDQLVSVYDCHI